jgi:hypothetical protein
MIYAVVVRAASYPDRERNTLISSKIRTFVAEDEVLGFSNRGGPGLGSPR